MKFDPGNLIYIILMLIFVIVGAAGKKKKPRGGMINTNTGPGNMAQPDEQEPGDILAENLRRLMGRYDQYDTPESIIPDEDTEIEMAEKNVEERAESLYASKGRLDSVQDTLDRINASQEESEIYDSIKADELGSEKKEQRTLHGIDRMVENFDAQKAVIYSEILNPKYF